MTLSFHRLASFSSLAWPMTAQGAHTSVCLTVCSKYKEMYGKYRIGKSLLVNSIF